jgi:hypothetical protein
VHTVALQVLVESTGDSSEHGRSSNGSGSSEEESNLRMVSKC